MGKKPARYDIDLVRSAATTRWPEIISAIGGVDRELLDGRHHPCPKCGGRDRFRYFTDNSGGAICSQCLTTKNGDGLAVLQWLTGRDFAEVLAMVCAHLGISPLEQASSNGKHGKKTDSDPAENLEFLPWDELAVAYWCLRKKPIVPAAVRAIGGQIALYRDQYKVVAVPVYGEKLLAAKPCGWIIYNITGGNLPKWSKVNGLIHEEWVKVKLTHGSQPGIVGTVDRLADATHAWKLEGSTDVLSLVSLDDLPLNVAVITTANGAKERPASWMVDLFKNKTTYVCHDADKPGQDGSLGWTDERGEQRLGWATAIATVANECRNVLLPYEVSDTHGKDMRDYLCASVS